MLNKLLAFIRRYRMVKPGDTVICAVSGGADSMALLWAMYLLRDTLEIRLEAAHFNHCLRGEESRRDEQFVRRFCEDHGICIHVGSKAVLPGEKGLEAAAREVRYAYFRSLDGIIATAHTADDNAETVLMHLIRGTGLKGLGGIAPVSDRLIRPMLDISRQEVLAFLEEYAINFVEDSTNAADDYLRNRVRHHILPLIRQENPSFCRNASSMARRLRQDEAYLSASAKEAVTADVDALDRLPPAIRDRVLFDILEDFGVREPTSEHLAQVRSLLTSENPSAQVQLPGNVTVCRNYGKLEKKADSAPFCMELTCPGEIFLPEQNVRILCQPAAQGVCTRERFTVTARGTVWVRSRRTGDTMRLKGGSKSLKKLYIDRKIPAGLRNAVPVVADEDGVLGVYGFGANLDRIASQPGAVEIRFEKEK